MGKVAVLSKSKSKTPEIYILILLVCVEAFCAIYGGISLIKDPTGESIHLSGKLLQGSVFSDYLIPGIVLFLLLGFFPLFLIFPLIFKPRWPGIDKLNIYPGYHWAWTYTLYTAIVLIVWINIQIMFMGPNTLIQSTFSLAGVIILIFTLMPRVKRYYRVTSHAHRHIAEKK